MADAKRLKEQGLIDENLGLNLPDKPLTEQEFLKLPKKDLQKISQSSRQMKHDFL